MRKPLLSICAIAKNEGNYIREWLSFHHAVGVERFFIYDNNSTDHMLEEIRNSPYAEDITVIPWPMIPGQLAAYHHMIANFREEAEWCAFIDCDEFLCPRTENSIPHILSSVPHGTNALYVYWLIFGSSGQIETDPAPVTQRFLRRAHDDFGPNNVGKSVVRLSAATRPNNPHVIQVVGRMITENGRELDQNGTGIFPPSTHNTIALNHYFTKSLAEWRSRRSQGKADKIQSDSDFIRDDREFALHDGNAVEDLTASNIMSQETSDLS
jgi:hypothetical protein